MLGVVQPRLVEAEFAACGRLLFADSESLLEVVQIRARYPWLSGRLGNVAGPARTVDWRRRLRTVVEL